MKRLSQLTVAFALLWSPLAALAQGAESGASAWFADLVGALAGIVFYSVSIGGKPLPVIVLWLIGGAVFCTLYFKFLQFRSMRLALRLVRGEFNDPRAPDCGNVRIGLTPVVTLTSLGEAFNWFRNRFRHVNVQLIEGLMGRVLPKLRDGSLDIAVVASDCGELRDKEFDTTHLRDLPQCIAVREGHPVLSAPGAQALARYEWVFTALSAESARSRVKALYQHSGATAPTQIVLAEALAALSLLRHSNVVCILPAALIGLPECRGIVAVPDAGLHPADLELLLLTQPDIPLTPAAAYFAHCLTETSRTAPAPA